MKLTADLITNSPTYLNAIKDRELDLSSSNLTMLENLGATRDLNDSLNLCHNNIRVLGNFPQLPRLQCLYLANNRISVIDTEIGQFLPNLRTLVLTNNGVHNLVDLEPLRKCRMLEHLSLVNNPVTRQPYARLWCVWRLGKNLRVLDFERITRAERKEARQLFQVKKELTGLAKSILSESATANTFVPGEGLEKPSTEQDAAKQQTIADLKQRIRQEMSEVEAMEDFI